MTITIDVPRATEAALEAEAARMGLPVSKLVEQVVVEHYSEDGRQAHKESTREFFSRIAQPGPEIDTSRDNIYADF